MLHDFVNEQWTKDASAYFVDGEGFWANQNNAVIEADILANTEGNALISIRVRTGDKTNPTSYVSSYKVEFDGVNVVMALDTTKPNEPRPEYGGSHIGWIKGSVNIPDTKLHSFKFIATKIYGGIDDLDIIDASAKQAYDKGVTDGKVGMYTPEEYEASYKKGFIEGKIQGITEGKQKQLDFDNAHTFTIAP